MYFCAGKTVLAGIVLNVTVTSPGKIEMFADLFGDGRRIFVKDTSYFGKRTAFSKHFLNGNALFG